MTLSAESRQFLKYVASQDKGRVGFWNYQWNNAQKMASEALAAGYVKARPLHPFPYGYQLTMADLICRFICKPAVFMADGADHTGVDVYLKCKSCGARGDHHIESNIPSAAIVKSLRREWRKGAFA